MADKLGVWNQATIHLGAAPVVSWTEDTNTANVFNTAWAGVVEEAFTEGDWNFAKKTAELVESTSTPSPGYDYAYDLPSDYERTIAISPTTDFLYPFYHFRAEGGLIHSNTQPLYIRYIRSDLNTDASVQSWPTSFWRFVAAKLAYETAERITQSTSSNNRLEKKMMKALRHARSVDARNEPGKEVPMGSWLRARNGGLGTGRDVSTVAKGEIVLGEGDV